MQTISSGDLEPGLVFDPTDEELVSEYLTKKAPGCTESADFRYIKDIDLYKHEPSQLSSLKCDSGHKKVDSGHKKMYFFTYIKRKYLQGKNIDRTTPGGSWRKTGSPSYVTDKNGNRAMKTSLTYYKKDGTSELAVKTEWLMKEYMLSDKLSSYQKDEESKMLCLSVVYPTRRTKGRTRDSRNNN